MVDKLPKSASQPATKPVLAPPGHAAWLTTDRATAQRLADVLAENLQEEDVAVSSFEVEDGNWSMAIHFSRPPNQTALRALVALEAGAALANALVFDRIDAKDWVAASLEGLAPVAAGQFVVHGRHDRARVSPGHIGIEIEAALAFGTGHHGTTRGCLLALDAIVKRQRLHLSHREREKRVRGIRVLDVGTGTGVLAIAAAKALRAPILASDIDRTAVTVARANARLNGVAPSIEFIHAAGLSARRFHMAGPFDLVLANILLLPLMRLARPMRRLLAPGGRVVLSGLLNNQAPTALAAYRGQGLVLQRRIVLGEWTTLVLRR